MVQEPFVDPGHQDWETGPISQSSESLGKHTDELTGLLRKILNK